MTGELGYWFSWVLGALLLVLCLGVTWWGLFGDSARGRRRCPKCWYDMSHTEGLRCPECGRTAAKEHHLGRTRRRLLPAAAGAIIAAGTTSWALERIQHVGWASLLPTRVILVGLPFSGGTDGGLGVEIVRRMGLGVLDDGDWQALVDRCLRGDSSARPVTGEWERKYGILLIHARNSAPKALELDEALLALPPRVELSSSRAWPRDAPVCLTLGLRHWWPEGMECRVQLAPAWDEAGAMTLYRNGGFSARRRRGMPIVIDAPADADVLEMALAVERRAGDEGEWETVHRETVRVPIERGPALGETIRPAGDEALDDAMRTAFSHGVVKWTGGPSPVRFRYDPRPVFGLEVEDTAIGVVVELRHDLTLARRLDLWWPAGDPDGGDLGWDIVYEDVELLARLDEDDERWTLSVRGDPAVALRAGPRGCYWAGEFDAPVTIQHVQSPAEPRPWRREPATGRSSNSDP